MRKKIGQMQPGDHVAAAASSPAKPHLSFRTVVYRALLLEHANPQENISGFEAKF
jgi:hypothetical protein